MAEYHTQMENYSNTVFEERSSPIAFENLADQQIYHDAQQTNQSVMNFTSESNVEGINAIPRPLPRIGSTNTIDQLVSHDIQSNLSINIDQYPINQDPNPEEIRRTNADRVVYRQDVGIRYLRPPTPSAPGPVIIREIRPPALPEAPPLIIRQPPIIPATPPPLIIREKPPMPPTVESTRIINKMLPAPPPPKRKVIIHRQVPMPQKPQPVIIEKWLPYPRVPERKVIVERAPPLIEKPAQKNMIITWDAPHVDLIKNVRNLGTIRADPASYVAQHGAHLSSTEVVLNAMNQFGVANNVLPQLTDMHFQEDTNLLESITQA